MSAIIVDGPLSAELLAVPDSVELRDAGGRVLGYFTPARPGDLEPDVSEAELERRFAAGGGRPLADILRDLERRG